MKPTPILFLDLDGTVRLGPEQLKGKFVNGPADVEIFDGVVDIIKSYKAKGWRVVAISNQGGIALGHVSESSVSRAMQETNRMCANLFDRMAWCTHHPQAVGDEYASADEKGVCFCRKPRIGMIVSVMISMAQQYDEVYRPYACLVVGDMETDRECAINANMPFMWAEEWRKNGPIS